MIYHIAEKFKSPQGEGVFAGTPMAFIRFVGCSVGKKVCHYCDTDFDKIHAFHGGGEFSEYDLESWVGNYEHVCLTGGEPFDQDLTWFFTSSLRRKRIHIETSGTKEIPSYIQSYWDGYGGGPWICVSPKPGWRQDAIDRADEIKVIVPGLGNGQGWPTLTQAVEWADRGKIVFLQPRNGRFDIDQNNLKVCEELVDQHPNLRLSVQLHKLLKVR